MRYFKFAPFTSHLMALLNAALGDLNSKIITLANRKLCLVIPVESKMMISL